MGFLRAVLVAGIVAASAIVVGAIRPDLPVVGALAAALRPPEPGAGAPAPGDPPRRREATADAEPAPEAAAPAATAAPEPPALYRFMDDTGALRIVDSIDQVPPAYRAKARRLETTPDRSAFDTTVSSTAPPRRRRQAVEEAARPRYDEVVLYKTSWCPACKKAAADLQARGVDFEMRDIEEDDDARAELREKAGMTAVPVLDVDGQLIRGYSPGAYSRLFGQR